MQVLGSTNPKTTPESFNSSHIYVYTAVSRFPRVFCPMEAAVSVQMIMFERPQPTRMQYMSLDPIPLALGDDIEKPNSIDEANEGEQQRVAKKLELVEKLKLHTVTKHPPSQKELALTAILNQVNCSMEMSRLLHTNVGFVGARSRRSLSVGERVVESASTLWDYIIYKIWSLITVWAYPTIRQAFFIGLLCHRIVAEVILTVLEWRVRPDYAALKDISATAQQVDIRLQQFCYWPLQYLTLRKRKNTWESITHSHPDYIRFYNSLWLVANDVIIGIALGAYIIDNKSWVAFQIDSILSTYTVDGLQRMINWLMDWPAGLKLNNELAAFLGDLFLWVIEYWASESAVLKLPRVIHG